MNGSRISTWGNYLMQEYDPGVVGTYVFRSWGHVALLLLVVGLTWIASTDANVANVHKWAAWARSRARLLSTLLLLWIGLATLAIHEVGFGGIPHIQDEIAYLFEARTFAGGSLSAPPLPERLQEAISTACIYNGPKSWSGMYEPAWPFALSLGVRLGWPGLVNSLLAVLAAFLIYHRTLSSLGPLGRLVGLFLLSTSPFFLIMAGSLMSHVFALVVFLLAMFALECVATHPRRAALALSLISATAILSRPQEVLPLLAPLSLVAFARLLKHRGPLIEGAALPGPSKLALLLLVSGWALGVVGFLGFNHVVTGDILRPPFLGAAPIVSLGFSSGVGNIAPEGHNVIRAVHNFWINIQVLSSDLFGWAYLGLVPAVWGLIMAAPRVGMLGVTALLLLFNYGFFFDHGVIMGARFCFPLLPLLVLLTVHGLRKMASGRGVLLVFTALVYLTLQSVVTYWPTRLESLPGYWSVVGGLTTLVPAKGLVMVPDLTLDGRDLIDSLYSLQDPFLKNRVLARDLKYLQPGDFERHFPGFVVHHISVQSVSQRLVEVGVDPAKLMP